MTGKNLKELTIKIQAYDKESFYEAIYELGMVLSEQGDAVVETKEPITIHSDKAEYVEIKKEIVFDIFVTAIKEAD